MMKPVLVGAAAATALLCAPPAFAHGHLKASVPADGAAVHAPASISLTFTEAVEAAFTGITLRGPTGEIAGADASVDPSDAAAVTVPVAGLVPGTYTVNWHAVGVDGHKTKGSFSFTVTN
jgi:hypothetical protein